ncbi:MAG: DNA gyrase/topoisomerase IV subunit A [Bacteroidales bacterium]|jgi:topoisomerase-4 subunit A|nr:DNA gyrase/topoisomerase IV subunit A [Bacteroidales bacterium]
MEEQNTKQTHKTTTLRGMYEDWFLDYASYVILERAVPHINDGLKPVQRRILHSMRELDDGRYNKVANIVGNTMKYHPHGDASIGDALVQLGQKELLIDMQGNWGNILTGDGAAAPRYIEARLSKFALEVVFNPQTTSWHPSYDGRNKEPDTLPIKFPLLLAQGVKGIAVGLACITLPHNFIELVDASIAILEDKPFEIYPDFPTGGMVDVSKYNEGFRGSRVRVRAKIKQIDKKTLAITEIPYSTTTESLIKTIVKASESGKIKIKKIDDNTARDVEILIHLPSDTSPDQTIDALYAFTDCELSIAPNSCVIENDKPRFISVSDILKISTQNTVDLLQMELEIALTELQEKWHWVSLERIFIENEIYEQIKPCKTDKDIDETIFEGLKPYTANLVREVTFEDVHKLRKIPIDRISKYNSNKADDTLIAIEDDIKQVRNDLEHIVRYAIAYFTRIREKYGKGKERKTEIRSFDYIEQASVAVANEKLYCDYENGFAGYKLKEGQYVCECSSIDDIIVFRRDGTFVVKTIAEKDFVGTDIIHIDVFRKNDQRTIYNMVYQDGAFGRSYIKRFNVVGVIRSKDYSLTKGTNGSRVLYFSANPNGEAETVTIFLKAKPKLQRLNYDIDFADILIKGRASAGNIVNRNILRKVIKKGDGVSTLAPRKIWFDDSVKRLNTDGRGVLLGAFSGKDKVLSLYRSGHFRLTPFDLTTHFDDDVLVIEKFVPQKPVSVIYLDNESNRYFVKRFIIDQTDKRINFLEEQPNASLIELSTAFKPLVKIKFDNKSMKNPLEDIEVSLSDFVEVMKYKAKGKRLSLNAIKSIEPLPPLPCQDDVPQQDFIDTEPENDLPQEEDGQISLFEP